MPTQEDMDLRGQLRALIEKNSTVNRVANDLGMSSSSQLYQFFQGSRGLTWATLVKVLDHCDITFAEPAEDD